MRDRREVALSRSCAKCGLADVSRAFRQVVNAPTRRRRVRSGGRWASFPLGVQLLNVLRGEKALANYPVTEENGELFVDA